MIKWFKERNGTFSILDNAVAMLHYIGDTHTLTQYSLRAQEDAKKILLGSEIDTSIRGSFSTVFPSILVGNKKETTVSAYECLVG